MSSDNGRNKPRRVEADTSTESSATSEVIGMRLREARQQDGQSLTSVANQADISVATLSRIETGKQSLDVDLMMTLARIVGVSPQRLVENDSTESDSKRLAARIVTLSAAERAELWREVAQRLRKRRPLIRSRRHDESMSHELMACFEVLHATLVPLSK